MDEYWTILETKTRRLIHDLVEPTIRRTIEQAEILDLTRKDLDFQTRRIEGIEIMADRINTKLGIIEEFSRRLVQFDADLRVSEVKFDTERDKIRDSIEVLSNRSSNCEENISILQGQTSSLRMDAVALTQDLSLAKTTLAEKSANLKTEIDANAKLAQDKSKGLELAISSVDRKCLALNNDLETTDIIAKNANRLIEKAVDDINYLTEALPGLKREIKESTDKIRMMTIQYNHQSIEGLKRVKDQIEQVKSEFPLQTHSQLTDLMYGSFEDLKTRKQIAEAEESALKLLELQAIPESYQLKVEEFKKRSQELIAADIPKKEAPKKKKKINLNDILNMDIKIKHHEEKMKNLEDKIINIEEKKSHGKILTYEAIMNHESIRESKEGLHRRDSSLNINSVINKESGDASSASSEDEEMAMQIEALKQNAAILAKFMGIKDHSQEIADLKEALSETQSGITTASAELEEKIGEKLQNLSDFCCEIQEKIEEIHERLQNIDSLLDQTGNELDKQAEQQAKDVKSLYESLSSSKSFLESEIASVSDKFAAYIESTSKTISTIEFQVQQAVNECNASSAQRKRDHNDNHSEFSKINVTAESILRQQESFSKQFDTVSKTLGSISEFLRIGVSLQYQDELDREAIALIGYKESKGISRGRPGTNLAKQSISLDKQCISCSGQVNLITAAFKIACLAYTPSPVNFRDQVFQRLELLEIQKKIIEDLGEKSETVDGSLERIRFSKTPKPAWRPPSSLSMYVSSGPANTPDLPPISLSRRINNY